MNAATVILRALFVGMLAIVAPQVIGLVSHVTVNLLYAAAQALGCDPSSFAPIPEWYHHAHQMIELAVGVIAASISAARDVKLLVCGK